MADSGRGSIPSLIRQHSVGDYVDLSIEQPHALAQADPAYFPKGVVNGVFHKKTFALSSTPPAKSNCQKKSPNLPTAARSALYLAKPEVREKYGPLPCYSLHDYRPKPLEHESDFYYFQIYINVTHPQSVLFAYVSVQNLKTDPDIQVEDYDFKHKFTAKVNVRELTALYERRSTSFNIWHTVDDDNPAPADVTTASVVARHTVVAQHRADVSKYVLTGYKKIAKESGYAKDFFMKINIGSKCLFVQLSADHHGGAEDVSTAEYDFSPQ